MHHLSPFKKDKGDALFLNKIVIFGKKYVYLHI